MIAGPLAEAEAAAARIQELLLDPGAGRLEESQRELDHMVQLLNGRPARNQAEREYASRMLLELRAMDELLTHCAAYYGGWLQIIGARAGGYTACGAAAPLEQLPRMRAEA